MSRALFVWWRVDASRLDEASATANALQAALVRSMPGLQARLYRRVDASAAEGGGGATLPSATVMETYAMESGGITAEVEVQIEAAAQSALGGLVDGERHVEAFEPLAAAPERR